MVKVKKLFKYTDGFDSVFAKEMIKLFKNRMNRKIPKDWRKVYDNMIEMTLHAVYEYWKLNPGGTVILLFKIIELSLSVLKEENREDVCSLLSAAKEMILEDKSLESQKEVLKDIVQKL